MRFGIYLPIEGPFADVGVLASLAVEAEAAGWDGFFVWDELLPIYDHSDPVRAAVGESGEVADAFVTLTAVAADTERIRFGPLVTPLARLRPEALAKQTATLDRFSGGRLVLGVGLGYPHDQFSAFGGPAELAVRAAMVDEFLDVLTRLWTGETVDVHGRFYTASGVSLHPPPLQQPRIPIWIGADGTAPAPRRRAARWDGFVPASPSWPEDAFSPAECAAMAADLASRRAPDAPPVDLVVIGSADGTRPAPAELAAYAEAGVTWVLAQALTVDDARARVRGGPPGS